MNSKKIRTAGAGILAFLVLLYVGYQAYLFTHKTLKTETAMYGEVSDTLQAKGFALRSEQVISDSYNGVLSYQVADGTRVSAGGVIAEVYASENDAAAQNKIDRLDREISNLQLLSKPVDFFASNPSLINSQIYTALDGISLSIRKNHFSDLSSFKEELQIALNRKKIMTGEESAEDYSDRIAALEEEKAAISASAGETINRITAPMAGYFISSTDGFENVMDISKVESITPSQVRDLLGRTQGTGLGSSVGKICADFKWYLVCVFSDNDMVKFEDVEEVHLDIPFASTETIPAKVAAKNRDPKTKETAVVFECSYMDSDIASVRNEAIQVNVRTYSGVLINERALRFCDVEYTVLDEKENEIKKIQENVKGVYVQYGGRLKFVQVFTEKTVNGYVICRTELTDEDRASLVTDSTVQLYDEVVIEGTDLYDGKLVR